MVTEEEIQRYLKDRNIEAPTITQLKSMVNWFAEGETTDISNALMEIFDRSDVLGGNLSYGIAEGCRCGSCYEWQVCDENNKVVASADTLQDFSK